MHVWAIYVSVVLSSRTVATGLLSLVVALQRPFALLHVFLVPVGLLLTLQTFCLIATLLDGMHV